MHRLLHISSSPRGGASESLAGGFTVTGDLRVRVPAPEDGPRP